MTVHDETFNTHPDLVDLASTTKPLPPPPAGRSRKGVLVGLVVVAVLVIGLGAWWLTASRVPNGDYDAVIADLDAANAELADLNQQIDGLDDEITALTAANERLDGDLSDLRDELTSATDELTASAAEVATLSADSASLRSRLEDASDVTEVFAYWNLNMHADWYRELVDMGLDVEQYDALLAELGYGDGFESWIDEGRGWVTNNSAVILVNDDQLLDAWVRWNESPWESDEETVAINEFFLRLTTLLYEAVAGE